MLSMLKISQKIYLLGMTQLLLMLAVGVIAFIQMDKIGTELVDIAENDIPLANKVTKISEHQLGLAILFERSLLKASLKEKGVSSAAQEFTVLSNKITALNLTIAQELNLTQSFIDNAISKLHSQEAKDTFQKLSLTLNNTRVEFKALAKEITTILLLTHDKTVMELYKEITKVEEHEDKIKHTIIDLLDSIQSFTLNAAQKAEADEQLGIKIISFIMIAAFILSLALIIIISTSITIPINLLKNRLFELNDGDGDLRLRLSEKGKDEIAEVAKAFNNFLSTLRNIISNTNQQANELGTSSDSALEIIEIALSNIEAQQLETEMVSTAVQEMSSTTTDVANNAVSASNVTELVLKKVLQGQAGAKETKEIIQRLAKEIEEAAKVIQSLVSEINSIGTVLTSIQGIAEQTNLLALNAAIEAARAGESGRGFAVVADEVRTLAQRTHTSTIDIQDLVERLQSETHSAVTCMKKGTDSANQCLEKSEVTSTIFDEATKAVNDISDLNTHTATAANQQSTVVEEVSENLVNITGIANKTTQGAKEISDANNHISQKLLALIKSLSRFKV